MRIEDCYTLMLNFPGYLLSKTAVFCKALRRELQLTHDGMGHDFNQPPLWRNSERLSPTSDTSTTYTAGWEAPWSIMRVLFQ